MKQSYARHAQNGVTGVSEKSAFDLVTDLDLNIEREMTKSIKAEFCGDEILGEEFSHEMELKGRVWTIDPIDGTCNMACGLPLFGVQCSLLVCGEPVLGAIYFPAIDETVYAVKGGGCYMNGERVGVRAKPLTHAIVSFCDFSHVKFPVQAARQYRSMQKIYPNVAKLRMFGAGCIDFAALALGRTDALVMITKNVWDLAPGIIICKEAGARICNLDGGEYCFGDDGLVASAGKEIEALILSALN